MEPTASKEPSPVPAGELVVQNGRCAGTRRPLGSPLTFIGRAQGCDIRLNIDGVDDLHCLLVREPSGLVLRDLGSSCGTLVNDQSVAHVALRDGDMLTVGSFQFLVSLPAVLPETKESPPEVREALHVQSAAVAAQQAALDEEEVRLRDRRITLESEEQELAAHLEDKRRRLQLLSERNQAERAALQRDRAAYERHINKITGDFTHAQKDLIEGQQKLQSERHRLADLHRRLRQRYHRFWLHQRQALQQRELGLGEEQVRLDAHQSAIEAQQAILVERRLRANTDIELGRQQLKEAWDKLRQTQFRWKHRRGKERAALTVRERIVEEAEVTLAAAQTIYLRDRKTWENQHRRLQLENQGLDQRTKNHRQLLARQRTELQQLKKQISERQAELVKLAAPSPAPAADKNGAGTVQEAQNPPVLVLAFAPPEPAPPASSPVTAPAAQKPEDVAALKIQWQNRLADLERHAGEVADQRLHLLEQWQRLALYHQGWHADRVQAADSLEDWSLRLQQIEQHLAEREADHQEDQRRVAQRRESLLQLRDQLVGWRAQLKIKESAWDGQRAQLLSELRLREEYAERQMQSLVDLKQRWQQRRHQELEQSRADRAALQALHAQYAQRRKELTERLAAVEDEKRVLAEKTLALEQYRQEFLTKAGHPGAERRLERLRRRWLTQNAGAIRAAARERDALAGDLAALDERFQDLQRRAALVEAAHGELVEAQTAWEHRQTLADARAARLQADLASAENHRSLAEQQLKHLHDEIERIARSLYDDPEPMALEQAA